MIAIRAPADAVGARIFFSQSHCDNIPTKGAMHFEIKERA